MLCLLLTGLAGFESSMLGVYVGAALMLAGLIVERPRVRQSVSALLVVLSLAAIPACLLNSGYRAPDYTADFKDGFETLKTRYVLGEYKGIDWDALYEKYLPRFEAVDRTHDEVENAVLWQEFVQEFYDGHVTFTPTSEKTQELASQRVCGNDYGLSLMDLSDGRTVAVNVEPDSAVTQAGIHNGTVITAWDGRSIDEVKAQIPVTVTNFADQDNAAFYSAILVAGVGGEQVEISFLNDAGEAQTVTAYRLGSYAERVKETVQILDGGYDAGNLTWTRLGEDTALLRIRTMMYDSESYTSTDHTKMKEGLRAQLLNLREEGVTRIIIDIRQNSGGSPHMAMAIASLFAEEGEHFYLNSGEWDADTGTYKKDPETGKYLVGETLTYTGENLWAQGEVIILAGAESISAADHFTMLMEQIPNVTVMGFTGTSGSGQAVAGYELKSGSLTFSAIPTMDEEGNIMIDSGTDHVSQLDVDVTIPFDEEAVRVLFDEGGDALLEKALGFSLYD
jgi:carboxyl-terminal processing protease